MRKSASASSGAGKAPAKLTPQQENFARHVVMGYSAAEAYRRCYRVKPGSAPSTHWVDASKLMARPHVRQRVAELRAAADSATVVTRNAILDEMGVNRTIALDMGKPSVAEAASYHRARVAGHLDRTPPPPPPPADDPAAMVAGEITIEDRSLNNVARRIAFTLALGRRQATAQKQVDKGDGI